MYIRWSLERSGGLASRFVDTLSVATLLSSEHFPLAHFSTRFKGLPLQPPYVRRAPGRPKKARRKANDEPNPKRMKKAPGTVTCNRCLEAGHNQRSCKGKTAADRLIPKGGNKSNTTMKHPEAQPGASVSKIQGSQSVSQIGAQNGAQTGVKTAAQTGQIVDVQGQNATTSNSKK
ncbi:hypothetical protein TSUD_408430 [Trifolium subterraneum]|uniref:CCHC-type domain-containing protein n=1 Tax=Trifolium subterraneum TaxID=3900 RepID=A0A2Z6P0G2_TRISU|nr:hypothetical protein TSUD_408430 [Trifolium subterraneum]